MLARTRRLVAYEEFKTSDAQCSLLVRTRRLVAYGEYKTFHAQCSAARCICAVLKANASAHTFESFWSRSCTGSAPLNAAQYPRLPLRLTSRAEDLMPRARNATMLAAGLAKRLTASFFCAFHSPPRGSRCCTGSASLYAAQYSRLPLCSASPAG